MGMKRILVVSKGMYRGVELYETPDGRVAFMLGMLVCSTDTLADATRAIDEWFDAKKN